MKLATVSRAAELLGVSAIRVRQLCQQGRVRGAEKVGRDWMIPLGADGRPRIDGEGSRGPSPTWAVAERPVRKRR